MPQLSSYINKATLKKIELAAKIENLSVSKFVVKKINESLNESWPGNFEGLFGSIDDESFKRPDQMDNERDVSRETL